MSTGQPMSAWWPYSLLTIWLLLFIIGGVIIGLGGAFIGIVIIVIGVLVKIAWIIVLIVYIGRRRYVNIVPVAVVPVTVAPAPVTITTYNNVNSQPLHQESYAPNPSNNYQQPVHQQNNAPNPSNHFQQPLRQESYSHNSSSNFQQPLRQESYSQNASSNFQQPLRQENYSSSSSNDQPPPHYDAVHLKDQIARDPLHHGATELLPLGQQKQKQQQGTPLRYCMQCGTPVHAPFCQNCGCANSA